VPRGLLQPFTALIWISMARGDLAEAE